MGLFDLFRKGPEPPSETPERSIVLLAEDWPLDELTSLREMV